MQLHQLRSIHKRKSKKRVGRGGKRGTYSGRGQKGQKSRAGHRIRPAIRDLLIRIPKLRGVKNKPIRPKPKIINVGELERIAGDGLLNKKILLDKKIIKKPSERVKLLGKGEVNKMFVIEGLALSEKAREKILRAGGKIK